MTLRKASIRRESTELEGPSVFHTVCRVGNDAPEDVPMVREGVRYAVDSRTEGVSDGLEAFMEHFRSHCLDLFHEFLEEGVDADTM